MFVKRTKNAHERTKTTTTKLVLVFNSWQSTKEEAATTGEKKINKKKMLWENDVCRWYCEDITEIRLKNFPYMRIWSWNAENVKTKSRIQQKTVMSVPPTCFRSGIKNENQEKQRLTVFCSHSRFYIFFQPHSWYTE